MVYKIFLLGFYTLQVIGWNNFEGTTFSWVYDESEGAEVQVPVFPQKVKALDGKEIELSGHFLPLEIGSKGVILSKHPYSSCFFCGGNVGAETVAEIQFTNMPPRFKLDEIVRIKGRLKLNERDLDHLTFIIVNATLLNK